jgi:simple sugar transport system ATP-binding protein
MLMVGHPLASYEIDPPKPGATLLETKGLRLVDEGREVLSDISLHVNAGEIVGIAGVSGNGQSELIRCITGLEKATGGQVLVGGKDVTNRSVREVRDAGLAHISEDRYVWGSAPEGTLEENALMARQDEAPFSSCGIIHPRAIRDYAVKLIRENLKATDLTEGAKVVQGDALSFLSSTREQFHLVFLDPPYDSGLLELALKKLSTIDILPENGIIVCESRTEQPLPELEGLVKSRDYRYGKTKVNLYRKED